MLSLLYFPMIYFAVRYNVSIIRKIICNVYDLVFFRYLNYYVILFYVNLLYQNENAVICGISSVLFIFFLIFVVMHQRGIYTIFHLNNDKVSASVINYPFDFYFMYQFHFSKICLKVITAVLYVSNQSASFYHSLKYISLTILFCSVILYQIYVIIQLLYLKFSLSYFILNNNHAVIFMTSIAYLTINIILFSIIHNNEYSIVIFLIVNLMNLIISVFITIIIWKIRIKNYFYNGKFSLYKLYYLVIYSDSYRTCVFGIFNLNCTKIILSMLYNHKLLCKTNKKCMICSKLNEKNENNLFSFSTLFFEIDKSDGKINKKRKYFRFNAESYVLFNKRKNVFI